MEIAQASLKQQHRRTVTTIFCFRVNSSCVSTSCLFITHLFLFFHSNQYFNIRISFQKDYHFVRIFNECKNKNARLFLLLINNRKFMCFAVLAIEKNRKLCISCCNIDLVTSIVKSEIDVCKWSKNKIE